MTARQGDKQMENCKDYTKGVIDALGLVELPEGYWISNVKDGKITVCYNANEQGFEEGAKVVLAWANNCGYHDVGGGCALGTGIRDICLAKNEKIEADGGQLPVNICHVTAEMRYTEDCEVNGIEEPDGSDANEPPKIFGATKDKRTGEWIWVFDVDVETGKIIDWPNGMTAKTHYKVVDGFEATFNGKTYGPDYVPDCFCLDDEGWGDYMFLTIQEDGTIKDWDRNRWAKFVKRLESGDNE